MLVLEILLADFILRADDILVESLFLALALDHFLAQLLDLLLVVFERELRDLKLVLEAPQFFCMPYCLSFELGERHRIHASYGSAMPCHPEGKRSGYCRYGCSSRRTAKLENSTFPAYRGTVGKATGTARTKMTQKIAQLWEILLPRAFNDGSDVPVPHHQLWDAKVQHVAGGLTILKKAKGIWRSPGGEIFREEMIPVRIACTEAQMHEIIDFTLAHYKQLAVMAYRISELVIIKHWDDV